MSGAKKPWPTADRVRELLDYDKENGIFRWRSDRSIKTKAGSIAGHLSKSARLFIRVDGRLIASSILAWLHVKGVWPERQVDHADTISSNDRWSNLRLATQSQNNANKRLEAKNKSGLKGVSWDKAKGRWRANIGHNGKQLFLGRFDTAAEAHAAYVAAAIRLYGEFARAA